MSASGLWIQLMLPAVLLVIGHAALVTKRFITTERAKLKSDESSAESNRMLGLAYQGQGLLDQAWDKFRQVPMSDAVMENLYNLGLDFERKRQFNKAESGSGTCRNSTRSSVTSSRSSRERSSFPKP